MRIMKSHFKINRDSRNLPKVLSLELFRWLLLASSQMLLFSTDQASKESEPQPLDLLKMVVQARERIASGEMEFEVANYEFIRRLDGTNQVRLKVLFDGEKRRFEAFGREYAYALIGPDAQKVTDAKQQELGLDREACVRAGLLTGFDFHRVTAFDGKVLMEYPRGGALALMDPKQGAGSYMFDPRVLGLTPTPSGRDTVENCLSHSPKSVQLAGKETLEGVVAWHIRVPYPNITYDYWIDANHPSRVLQCGFNGDTAFSKFDATNPDNPIPTEVRCVSFHGTERARSDVLFLRRRARFNIPIDSTSWTLAGLNLPVGTEAMDYRTRRGVGYWNGSGLSDNPPIATTQPIESKGPSNPAKLLELVEKDPNSLFAAHACFTVASFLKNETDKGADERAITKAEGLFERVISVCGQLGSGGGKLAELAKAELSGLRQLGVGTVAQEIDGEDMNGRKMKLSDYRGRVVVLTFWGTWCGPCMAMVPEERSLVEKMTGKAFSCVGINSDTDATKVKAAVEKEKITWSSFRDGGAPGPIATAWNVHSWPTIYVLDRKGVIRYRNVRGQALSDAVEALIH